MLASLSQVRSLLVAILMLMLGAGFLTTLVGVRLQGSGVDPLVIGIVVTSYFAGLTAGSLQAPAIVQRVGHIRAFAAFVSLLSASTLAYAIIQSPLLWTGLRFIDGCCIAGVYVCLESWLNDQAEGDARGGVLAGYMIALYTGQGLGQLLLNISDQAPSMPFVVASMLISLAVLPVALTRKMGPTIGSNSYLPIRALYAISPLGIVGAAVTGVMLGAFYGLGAVYARELGLSVSATAWFMTTVILGGVALQWPLGRLSDRFDRRLVIIAVFAGTVAAAFGLAMTGPGWQGLVPAALFGGFSFALYPLCVAHTNDHLMPEQRVGASGGLVLVYSLGSACGPLIVSGTMSLAGPSGLFLSIGVIASAILVFALWRQFVGAPVPADQQGAYQVLPRTTPVSARLDPLSSETVSNDMRSDR
ncbi:MAG: MFS transporter [Sphingomonas sp.]|nr:MFS transporter [Sphingomonas sp.]